MKSVHPFPNDSVNTSGYEWGNANILVLQGKGGHPTDQGQAGSSSKELWQPDSVLLTLSLFVDLFLFQCRPDQNWHEQTHSVKLVEL